MLAVKEVKAFQFNRWSPETAWNVLIRLDSGAKVWGRRFDNLNKGDRVSVTAKFKQSNDPKFGFFWRPRAEALTRSAIVIESRHDPDR